MTNMTLAQAPSTSPQDALSFDLRAVPEDYFAAPHRYLKALRDWDPLHRNADGSILITRHEDVRRVWKDLSAVVDKRDAFAAKFGPGALLEHHTSTMLFRDPPDHDRLRAIVTPFFKPDTMLRLRADVERHVDALIAAVRTRDEIDFVTAIAYPVTSFVICRMLGLPTEDGALIGDLGRRIALPLNPDADAATIASGHAAASAFKAYLLERIEVARRAAALNPGADILSAIVAAERDGARISEVEMQHMLILMLNGGYESTSNLLSVAMLGLVDDPARLDDLRRGEMPLSAAMEELFRFVTPLQLQGRRLTRPIALPAFARAFEHIERAGPVAFRPTPRFRGIHSLPLRLRR